MVCLNFSRDIHPIFPTFIKFIFKAVNGTCIDDIKRNALPVIYNRVIEKCRRIVVLKGGFFNLKLSPLVMELLSTTNKCSNNGHIHSILYKP